MWAPTYYCQCLRHLRVAVGIPDDGNSSPFWECHGGAWVHCRLRAATVIYDWMMITTQKAGPAFLALDGPNTAHYYSN
ncbi:hypothetical protein SLA2020_230080 [Shorea laevis]